MRARQNGSAWTEPRVSAAWTCLDLSHPSAIYKSAFSQTWFHHDKKPVAAGGGGAGKGFRDLLFFPGGVLGGPEEENRPFARKVRAPGHFTKWPSVFRDAGQKEPTPPDGQCSPSLNPCTSHGHQPASTGKEFQTLKDRGGRWGPGEMAQGVAGQSLRAGARI